MHSSKSTVPASEPDLVLTATALTRFKLGRFSMWFMLSHMSGPHLKTTLTRVQILSSIFLCPHLQKGPHRLSGLDLTQALQISVKNIRK